MLAAVLLLLGALAITRCLDESPAPPAVSGDTCVLSAAIDGDSVRCADGREVRLLSIDAPEIAQRPFGERSRAALLELVPIGTALEVEYDIERRDGFGRDLAYLHLPDGAMLNASMVERGYAVAFVIAPNRRHADRMRAAERVARSTGAGLWASWGFSCRPVDFRGGRCGS